MVNNLEYRGYKIFAHEVGTASGDTYQATISWNSKIVETVWSYSLYSVAEKAKRLVDTKYDRQSVELDALLEADKFKGLREWLTI